MARVWPWPLAALLIASTADAEQAASYRYGIHHQMFGEIGEHRIVVSGGDPVVVEHDAELTIEVFGIRAFHRKSRYRETWRDGRLIAFEGLTVDNDEPFQVSARAAGDRLVIEGVDGTVEAPAMTAPSQPSLPAAIEREQFFDIKTGALLAAAVTAAGHDRLPLGEQEVEAERYEVAGELRQHVWFDDGAVWVQWRLWRQGAAITLVRE